MNFPIPKGWGEPFLFSWNIVCSSAWTKLYQSVHQPEPSCIIGTGITNWHHSLTTHEVIMKDNKITNYTMTKSKSKSPNVNKIGASAAVTMHHPSSPNEILDHVANAQQIIAEEASWNRNNEPAPPPANVTGANNNTGREIGVIGGTGANATGANNNATRPSSPPDPPPANVTGAGATGTNVTGANNNATITGVVQLNANDETMEQVGTRLEAALSKPMCFQDLMNWWTLKYMSW